MRSLCIEGWRGVNHSIAMVNQNQILELAKLPGWTITHRDAPFFLPHWDPSKLDSGFSPAERAVIDGLAPATDAPVDVCFRIASPVRAGRPGSARRNVTYVVTEFGLSAKSFDPVGLTPASLTRGEDRVVTPSQWSKARLLDHGFDAEKVFVVPHGYKTDSFFPMSAEQRAQARQTLGIQPDEVVFTNVGVSTWNKGIDLVILAYAQLRLQGLPVRLILKDHKGLYGLGVERTYADLASRAPQLNQEQVTSGMSILSGSLNLGQIRSLYALSDAYVSPYRAEGFNLPVLEAMGCGTPVIVSGGGATDDFVPPELGYRLRSRPGTQADAPQVEGHFVMPDLDDLIHAMQTVAERRWHADATAREAARQRVATEYSWGNVTAQLVAHF